RGDANGVDILAADQVAKVVVAFAVFVHVVLVNPFHGALEMRGVHVGDGDDAAILFLQKGIEVAAALPADADATHRDLFPRRPVAALELRTAWRARLRPTSKHAGESVCVSSSCAIAPFGEWGESESRRSSISYSHRL